MSMRRAKKGQSPLARVPPVSEWPGADRAAWEAACTQASPLDPPGLAVKWSDATRKITVQNWGRLITFLASVSDLDPAETPAQRLTYERCTAFIISLRQRLSPNSLDVAIVFLCQAASALAPRHDWRWVQRHPLRPSPKEIREARKPRKAPDAEKLLAAALDACDAVDGENPTADQANHFRDAVLVAFTVTVAVRRRNVVETRVGTNLLLNKDTGSLFYPSTKTGEPFQAILTPMLVDVLNRYVQRHRPVLLAASGMDTDALWISKTGRPMNASTAYNIFRETTDRLIGERHNIHSARHALVTGMLRRDPKSLDVASAALGHGSTKHTRGAYDLSGADASNQEWQRLVAKVRAPPKKRKPPRDS